MKDNRITFRIKSELKDKWQTEAENKGISLSALITLVMNQYLKELQLK